jgi:hypothetical protein
MTIVFRDQETMHSEHRGCSMPCFVSGSPNRELFQTNTHTHRVCVSEGCAGDTLPFYELYITSVVARGIMAMEQICTGARASPGRYVLDIVGNDIPAVLVTHHGRPLKQASVSGLGHDLRTRKHRIYSITSRNSMLQWTRMTVQNQTCWNFP